MVTRARIQIVDAVKDLETYLCSVKNTRIDIAVAFASKTESLIETMLKNGNRVNLVLGTINYFSDPVFIRHCQLIAQKNHSQLDFAVDFRRNESIHWKVYLIAPKTVIIGSPNLTMTGISMQRDTAVAISDVRLYKTYLSLIAELTRNNRIVDCCDSRFEDLLSDYKEQHRRFLPGTVDQGFSKRRPVTPPSLAKWLKQDVAQILPVFIWDDDLTSKERRLFKEKIRPKVDAALGDTDNDVYIIGCYEGSERRQHYRNDDIILTVKSNGGYVYFEQAVFVIYGAGNWWLCGIRNKRFSKPFALTTDVKKAMKKYIRHRIQDDKSYLDSNDLRKLDRTARKM
jgi:hypothetical protein